MTAFDRRQVIESAAKAIHDQICIFHRDGQIQIGHYGIENRSETDMILALPVIVAAVLKPIRELRAAGEPVCVETGHTPSLCPCSEVFCEGCGESMPCPTIRLLDEIEAAAKGGEDWISTDRPATDDAATRWLRNYHGSIDSTALLLAFRAGQKAATHAPFGIRVTDLLEALARQAESGAEHG